jgi:hypothetical protein
MEKSQFITARARNLFRESPVTRSLEVYEGDLAAFGSMGGAQKAASHSWREMLEGSTESPMNTFMRNGVMSDGTESAIDKPNQNLYSM